MWVLYLVTNIVIPRGQHHSQRGTVFFLFIRGGRGVWRPIRTTQRFVEFMISILWLVAGLPFICASLLLMTRR